MRQWSKQTALGSSGRPAPSSLPSPTRLAPPGFPRRSPLSPTTLPAPLSSSTGAALIFDPVRVAHT